VPQQTTKEETAQQQTQTFSQLYKEGKNTARISKDGNLPQSPADRRDTKTQISVV
jgi:hypothetical protein